MIRDALRGLVKQAPGLERRVRLSLRAQRLPQPGAHPDWPAILGQDQSDWDHARQQAKSQPQQRVLIASSMGAYQGATCLDSVLAVALTLRGAAVTPLLCDGVLPACQECTLGLTGPARRFARRGPGRQACQPCYGPAAAMWQELGLPATPYSEAISLPAIDEAKTFAQETQATTDPERRALTLDGHPVGEHALAGALRYFAVGQLAHEPQGDAIFRRFLNAAVLAVRAAETVIDQTRPDVAIIHHGLYTPQGLIASVCRRRGVRVVTWNPAYRRGRFIFSHGDTYHHTLLSEPSTLWNAAEWDDDRRQATLNYLDSRRHGQDDWVYFHGEKPRFNLEAHAQPLGLDLAQPFTLVLTNVVWDAQLHYQSGAFASMTDWLIRTVQWFARHPDRQAVIRIHPAEVNGALPTREPAMQTIQAALDTLGEKPSNLIVIPPDHALSTYALADRAKNAVIFGTKTGVELAAQGLPVLVAGEAWVRGKGLTQDAKSEEDYFDQLRKLDDAPPLDGSTRDRALRYAHHFFFRRMIPIDVIGPGETGVGRPPFRVTAQGLSPFGADGDPGLQTICRGILKQSPMIYDPAAH